jgi:glycerophosphoryl diester phosphodiesterase
MKRFSTIAHRGFKSNDNSELAIQNAIRANFNVIEVNIHKTLDKHIILHHNLFLNGYNIEKTPLDILQQIDPQIITIERFFEITFLLSPMQNHFEILLDLKGSSDIVDVLITFLETIHSQYLSRILISTFQRHHIDALIKSKIKVAGIGISICNDFLPQEVVPYIDFVSVDMHILSSNLINVLRKYNLVIFSFTCTSEQEYRFISSYDVDGIITDILL